MSRTNETSHIEWHENCKCKCRIDASISNNKQRRNIDKCRSECKELIDKGISDKRFIWNPSYCECECECHESCDVEIYLVYEKYTCRERLIDKLVEEWNEDIDGNKMTNVTLNEYKNICGTCIINTVLLVIFLSDFIYFHWYLKRVILILILALKQQLIKRMNEKYQTN